jgi:hypothetical protein
LHVWPTHSARFISPPLLLLLPLKHKVNMRFKTNQQVEINLMDGTEGTDGTIVSAQRLLAKGGAGVRRGHKRWWANQRDL